VLSLGRKKKSLIYKNCQIENKKKNCFFLFFEFCVGVLFEAQMALACLREVCASAPCLYNLVLEFIPSYTLYEFGIALSAQLLHRRLQGRKKQGRGFGPDNFIVWNWNELEYEIERRTGQGLPHSFPDYSQNELEAMTCRLLMNGKCPQKTSLRHILQMPPLLIKLMLLSKRVYNSFSDESNNAFFQACFTRLTQSEMLDLVQDPRMRFSSRRLGPHLAQYLLAEHKDLFLVLVKQGCNPEIDRDQQARIEFQNQCISLALIRREKAVVYEILKECDLQVCLNRLYYWIRWPDFDEHFELSIKRIGDHSPNPATQALFLSKVKDPLLVALKFWHKAIPVLLDNGLFDPNAFQKYEADFVYGEVPESLRKLIEEACTLVPGSAPIAAIERATTETETLVDTTWWPRVASRVASHLRSNVDFVDFM
jgi:hypothetical protein